MVEYTLMFGVNSFSNSNDAGKSSSRQLRKKALLVLIQSLRFCQN